MTEELQVLWSLRGLDEEQAALKQALVRFPEQRMQLEGRVTAEKARLETLRGRIAELQKNRRGREKDIEAATVEERKFQSQLPAIKKNEEYQALLHQIQGAKARRSEIETEVLMLFEEEEQAQAERPAIEQALAAAEKEASDRRAAIDREEAADQEKFATVEAERVRLLEKLTPPTRARYERVHGSRDGRAVVAVLKGSCGGCYRALPPQIQVEAKRGDRILTCEGCGRIVIWPPEAC
jgi:predicted  nucleic acid-binding Zn-ribbon protein